MLKNKKIVVFVAVVASVISLGLFLMYKNLNETLPAESAKPLVMIQYVGGGCAYETCTTQSIIYSDGTYEQHSKLSSQELSKLSKLIEDTDFTSYQKKSNPDCASAYDGFDQIIIIPSKYPDKKFVSCQLDINDEDPFYSYIDSLSSSHALDQ